MRLGAEGGLDNCRRLPPANTQLSTTIIRKPGPFLDHAVK